MQPPQQLGQNLSTWQTERKDEEEEETTVCVLLEPLSAGYFICLLVFIEGIILLLDSFEVIGRPDFLFAGLAHNPLRRSLWLLLQTVAIGDVLWSLAATLGIFFAKAALFWPSAIKAPVFLVGALLIWRSVVAFLSAPWMGVMLAFKPPDYQKFPDIFATLLFIAFNLYMIWTLCFVLKATSNLCSSNARQLAQMRDREHQALMAEAHSLGYPDVRDASWRLHAQPTMFGCLPLEGTVVAYSVVLCLLSAWWLLNCLTHGRTGGGWAFFVAPDNVSLTMPLEVWTCCFTSFFSFVALWAISLYRTERENIGDAHYMNAAHVENGKRSVFLVLIYFGVSLMRLSAFIPITGMALFEMDLCGFHTYGLASISLKSWAPYMAPIYCTRGHVGILALVAVILVADIYLVWGVLKLWQRLRMELALNSKKKEAADAGFASDAGSYGATDLSSSW